jgi:hypothetical protein
LEEFRLRPSPIARKIILAFVGPTSLHEDTGPPMTTRPDDTLTILRDITRRIAQSREYL